jgi:hypothetical protein
MDATDARREALRQLRREIDELDADRFRPKPKPVEAKAPAADEDDDVSPDSIRSALSQLVD